MKNLSQKEWEKAISQDSKAVVLDVRTPSECASGIINEAIQADIMNSNGFFDAIEKLDSSQNYYVYCRSGGRSGQACQLMSERGLTTFNLVGGMMNWEGEVIVP